MNSNNRDVIDLTKPKPTKLKGGISNKRKSIVIVEPEEAKSVMHENQLSRYNWDPDSPTARVSSTIWVEEGDRRGRKKQKQKSYGQLSQYNWDVECLHDTRVSF